MFADPATPGVHFQTYDPDTILANASAATDAEFMAAGGDRVTMFQDAACTIPVKKVEDPIGGFISSERGTTRGPELLTNGTFDSATTGWTAGGDTTLSVDAGRLKVAATSPTGSPNGGAWSTALTCVVGKTYEVQMTVTAGIGQAGWGISTSASLVLETYFSGYSGSSWPSRVVFVATSTTHYVAVLVDSTNGTQYAFFDDISVRQLPGKVATQTTAGFRPKLDARVNLATSTEVVATATPWNCNNFIITNGALATGLAQGVGPAYLTKIEATSTAAATSYTMTVPTLPFVATYYVHHGTRPDVAMLIRNNTTATSLINNTLSTVGVVSGSGSWTATPVGGGVYRVSVLVTTGFSSGDVLAVYYGAISTVTAGLYWYAGGMDVRTAADAALVIPPYQAVRTPTDYDYTGFPMRVRGDGVDDSLSVPLNMSTTDKVTAWMGGNLKTNDAAERVLFEFTSVATNPGGLGLYGPGGGGIAAYYARSTGSLPSGVSTGGDFPAPRNDVVTLSGDIAADTLTLDVNGVQAATIATDQGTGNLADSTLYICARAGTSLYSGAGWSSLTILGRTANAGEKARALPALARHAKINL